MTTASKPAQQYAHNYKLNRIGDAQNTEQSYGNVLPIIKPPLAIARAALCIGAVHLFVCLSVSLSVCRQNAKKNAIFSKTKQFRAMVSIVDL